MSAQGLVRHSVTAISAAVVLAMFAAAATDAREFRVINPIVTPERIPQNAERIDRLRPVNRKLVEQAVRAMAEAWNSGRLDPILDPDRFYNKDRLLDTIAEVVPRDARLTVLSVGGVTTLEQYFQPRKGYKHQISVVAAIVRTQIEFTDPEQGFLRLEGRNEFVFEIAERVRGS